MSLTPGSAVHTLRAESADILNRNGGAVWMESRGEVRTGIGSRWISHAMTACAGTSTVLSDKVYWGEPRIAAGSDKTGLQGLSA